MMEIFGHIGNVSGLDDAIYSNTDIGTAQKILSLAKYLLATNGQFTDLAVYTSSSL